MRLINEIKKSAELKEYWESLLGKELLEHAIRHPELLVYTEEHGKWLSDEERRKVIENLLRRDRQAEDLDFGQEVSFEPFFRYIAEYAAEKLKVRIPGNPSEKMIHHAALQITESLSWMCIRCLIHEMHCLKEEDLLQGKDSIEEYQYFCDRYLNDFSFVKDFLEKYPVLTGLIASRTEASVEYMYEIFVHLERDKQDISLQLCGAQDFTRIKDIWMNFSDEHFPGRTAVKLLLDNDCYIYHKPHGLSLAVYYDDVQQWVMEKCGIEDLRHRRLDRGNYGWEAEITYCGCSSRKEVENYYFRVGMLVCVTYVLGISDLHYENIIPHGEYPILVDVEFIADQRLAGYVHPRRMQEFLKDTVVNTGLLPTAIGESADVNVGGLGELGEQRAPYLMPIIVNDKTSDMTVSYEFPVVNAAKSLPEWNGQRVDYRDYISFVIAGFTKAYEAILHHKEEFIVSFGEGFDQKSRFLFRNTQEYFMYQHSINFPEFMSDSGQKRLMLIHMENGLRCNEKFRREILQYEMANVYNHIIPIFYSRGRDLYLGNGSCLKDYFESDGKTHILARLGRLSKKDYRFQRQVMEIVFLSVTKVNPKWASDAVLELPDISGLSPEKIADSLLEDMLAGEKDFGWIGICYSLSGRIYPEILDPYLYNGLCGVAVFFAALQKKHEGGAYFDTYRQIAGLLFEHTDKAVSKQLDLKDCGWGLFTGEASLVYTYLVLYRITKEVAFLNYAEKQAGLVINHLEEISEFDFLSGKAGVIAALVLLYEETGDMTCFEAAVKLGGLLEKEAVPAGGGIGWTDDEFPPLAGLAHGNSGMALAYAYLYRVTHNEHYKDVIKSAICYEDTLYDAKKRNWMDIRECGQEESGGQDTVAWCHGAAGILSARLAIRRMTGLDMDILFRMGTVPKEREASSENPGIKQQSRQVQNESGEQENGNAILEEIADKIRTAKKQDLCLCHGTVGLIEMIRCYERYRSEMDDTADTTVRGERIQKSGTDTDSMINQLRKRGAFRLSVEDRNNPGLMLGLSGIGYAMLREQDDSLPWILIPE